jgi:CMP-N-acetylneuraminate monooxygenase
MVNMNIFKANFDTLSEKITINLDDVVEGTNLLDKLIVYREGSIIKVYDRVCDHNKGKLMSIAGEIKCPLHGWELDPASGKYKNVDCEKKPIEIIDLNELDAFVVDINIKKEIRRTKNSDNIYKYDLRFINHACIIIDIKNVVKIATDPWVEGPCFQNGWWLQRPSKIDAYDEINSCDYIYISHNHPDHLHEISLENIRNDMKFIIPNFESRSTEKTLKKFGFNNLIKMDFDDVIMFDEDINFSMLKSGDFRDDSGFLFEIGEAKILSTVDSNFIDFGRINANVDILLSAFAGGASGFPLCFNNYTESEKVKIVQRNKRAIFSLGVTQAKNLNCKYFIPYAGFFKESEVRDKYIKDLNSKNSVADYEKLLIKFNIQTLDLFKHDFYEFNGVRLHRSKNIDKAVMSEKPLYYYLEKTSENSKNLDERDIVNYFLNSKYHEDLLLNIELTNDQFEPTGENYQVKFSRCNVPECYTERKIINIENYRTLNIQARQHEFKDVIKNKRSWEDLSIGFQLRITRSPNIYNSKFWDYFTNEYI